VDLIKIRLSYYIKIAFPAFNKGDIEMIDRDAMDWMNGHLVEVAKEVE